ncbi:MAG: carboxypeptidase-like regulatory domain-containing protein [Fibrobacterota bacterium]
MVIQKTRLISLTICIIFFSLVRQGYCDIPIRLEGTVADEDGTPLEGARLTLAKQDYSAKTDETGSFVLTNNISVIRDKAARNRNMRLEGNSLHVENSVQAPLFLRIYDIRGRLIHEARRDGGERTAAFTLPADQAKGVYQLALRQNERTHTMTYFHSPRQNTPVSPQRSLQRAPSVSESVTDTIHVSCDGYETFAYPLDEYVVEDMYLTLKQSYHLHTNIMASTFWVGQGAGDDNHNISNVSSSWDSEWGDRYGLEDAPTLSRDNNFFPRDSRYRGIENPYYFALPYNDYSKTIFDGSDQDKVQTVANLKSEYYVDYNEWLNRNSVFTDRMGPVFGSDQWTPRKLSTEHIPWQEAENWQDKSMVKGRWIRIRYEGSNWVYAQWLDAGPYHYDDVNYVFGTARPRNEKGSGMDISPHAGIDLSPAVWLKLGVDQEFFDDYGGINDNVDWQFVDREDVPDGPWTIYESDNYTNW